MNNSQKALALIGKIHDLPFEDDLREIMSSFSDVLSTPTATFMRYPTDAPTPLHMSTFGVEQAPLAEDLAHLYEHNLWVQAMQEREVKNGLMLGSELVQWSTFSSSIWYNELLRHHGLCDAISINTFDSVQGYSCLTWYSAPEQGQFSRQKLAELQPYYGLLKKSIDLRIALDERDLELAFFNDIANKSGAFALCHLNGNVVVADKAFEQVLANKEGLALTHNRIQPLDSQSRQTWQRQWALTKQHSTIEDITPAPFQIKRQQNHTPLVAEMWFYQHKGGTVLKSENYILIRLQGTSKGHQLPSVHVLIEAFSLSHAEARVALLLCEGLTPAQVALQRQTSLVTVRNQVRSVLTKMHLPSVPQLITTIFGLSR